MRSVQCVQGPAQRPRWPELPPPWAAWPPCQPPRWAWEVLLRLCCIGCTGCWLGCWARSWEKLWRQCSLVLTVKPSSRPAKIPDCSSNFDNAAPSSPSSLAQSSRLDDGHPTPGQLTSIARPAICGFPLCSPSVTSGRAAPSIFSKCLPRPESTYVQAFLPLRGPFLALARARTRTIVASNPAGSRALCCVWHAMR